MKLCKILKRENRSRPEKRSRFDFQTLNTCWWIQTRRFVLLTLDCGHTQERRRSEIARDQKRMKCNHCAQAARKGELE
jgi:hypothetical protein